MDTEAFAHGCPLCPRLPTSTAPNPPCSHLCLWNQSQHRFHQVACPHYHPFQMQCDVPAHCNTGGFFIPLHSTYWCLITHLQVSLPHHTASYLRAWILSYLLFSTVPMTFSTDMFVEWVNEWTNEWMKWPSPFCRSLGASPLLECFHWPTVHFHRDFVDEHL